MSYKIKNGANLALTQIEIDALTPAIGDVVYNTTEDKLQAYGGSSWDDISGGGGGDVFFYGWNPRHEDFSITNIDNYIEIDTLPSVNINRGTNWTIACKLTFVGANDGSNGIPLFSTDNDGFSISPDGSVMYINSTFIPLSPNTTIPSSGFVVIQNDSINGLNVWINGERVLTNSSNTSISTLVPTQFAIGADLTGTSTIAYELGQYSFGLFLVTDTLLSNTEVLELSRQAYQINGYTFDTDIEFSCKFTSTGATASNGSVTEVVDGSGGFHEYLPFGLIPLGAATDITLTPDSVEPSATVGTVVGTLEATYNDYDTYTFSLVSGTGDTDNANYSIDGTDLEVAAALSAGTDSIRVRATSDTDSNLTYEKALNITIASTGVLTASVTDGGFAFGVTDGDYTATQLNTSGGGTGAEFTVTVSSDVVTAIVSVDTSGSGYAVNDTITLTVASDGSWFSDPILTVNSIG